MLGKSQINRYKKLLVKHGHLPVETLKMKRISIKRMIVNINLKLADPSVGMSISNWITAWLVQSYQYILMAEGVLQQRVEEDSGDEEEIIIFVRTGR